MTINFNEKIDRKGTNCVKWEFISVGKPEDREEMLPLSIADMDFAVAKEIRDAMKERIDRKIFGYTLSNSENYNQSVTNWFERRFDWKFSADSIVTAPGIVPALAVLVKAFSQVNEGVIIQTPVYYPFYGVIKENGRKVIANSLVEVDGKYTMDFDKLEKQAKDPNNTMMILCSPHNPMGRVWTKDELEKVIDLCVSNGIKLVSDEIHCDLVRSGIKHIPVAKISDHKDIITCTAASKSFNLAGLQHSNIIFNNPEDIEQWTGEMLGKSGLFGDSIFGHTATMTAYNDCEYWLEELNEHIEGNLKYVDEFVKEQLPKAIYHIPEGTYFAWIDLRAYGHSAETLEKKMVEQAKLVLDEGYIFGEEGIGFERLNVACTRNTLEQCLNRMRDVLI